MYIFVSFQEKDSYYRDGSAGVLKKARLEEASGEPCLIVPFFKFSLGFVRELNVSAVVMGGFPSKLLEKPELFKGVREFFLGSDSDMPILCFCGSFQLIYGVFNKGFAGSCPKIWKTCLMKKLDKTDDFPRYPAFPGHFSATGFFPVRQVKKDPVFAGLPENMIMNCQHQGCMEKVPEGFELLASSPHSKIEMIRHKTRLFYGTQFHPENYAEPFMDGRKMLENFARIVKLHGKKSKTKKRLKENL